MWWNWWSSIPRGSWKESWYRYQNEDSRYFWGRLLFHPDFTMMMLLLKRFFGWDQERRKKRYHHPVWHGTGAERLKMGSSFFFLNSAPLYPAWYHIADGPDDVPIIVSIRPRSGMPQTPQIRLRWQQALFQGEKREEILQTGGGESPSRLPGTRSWHQRQDSPVHSSHHSPSLILPSSLLSIIPLKIPSVCKIKQYKVYEKQIGWISLTMVKEEVLLFWIKKRLTFS